MLAENERAANAALSVGYERVTQFNREYNACSGNAASGHKGFGRYRTKAAFLVSTK